MPRERMSTCASRGVMRVIRPTTVSPTLRTEDAAADRLRLACTILPVTIPATDARSAPSHTNVEPASAGVLAGNLSPGTTIVSAAIFLVLYCFSWSEPSDTEDRRSRLRSKTPLPNRVQYRLRPLPHSARREARSHLPSLVYYVMLWRPELFILHSQKSTPEGEAPTGMERALCGRHSCVRASGRRALKGVGAHVATPLEHPYYV